MGTNSYAELAELAGGFIHEIKNHLSTLGLNLQLLQEDFHEPQTQRERRAVDRVNRLQSECQRLIDLSNDFLRFARAQQLQLAPTDLAQVVEEMVDFFDPMARQGGIDIKSYLPADLPPVRLDREVFKQALLNLLLNAEQAMPGGGELTIQAGRGAGEVWLSLIDTGKGMSPEVLAKVFRPFYSTKAGGSGLGLPTTRKIIDAHGGTIEVQSEPDHGTKFTLHLPAEMPGDHAPQPVANLNGARLPLSEVKVSALDRGFLFGDAVYEVLRVYQGRPWLEAEHFERFRHSLDAIRIGGVDLDRLRRRMHETIASGGFREAIVYLQVTRGSAPRGHAFPAQATPLEFLFVQPFQDPYTAARQAGAAVVTHPDLRWKRCDIKSTNLLGNVLAMQAAKDAGGLEAILYHPDGTVTEGTHTSLFGVVDGKLRTSPKGNPILPGITRDLVLRLAAERSIPVEERSLHRDEFPALQELFLTGTTSEVLPIVRVDGQPVGTGTPGPITRALQQGYDDAVRAFLAGT